MAAASGWFTSCAPAAAPHLTGGASPIVGSLLKQWGAADVEGGTLGMTALETHSDPNAPAFYVNMGTRVMCNMARGLVANRNLPSLISEISYRTIFSRFE